MIENVEIVNLQKYISGQVRISGLVEKIEDHGGILFLEINDLSALANAMLIPDKEKAFAMASNLKPGYLVEIFGTVKQCPLSARGFCCEVEVETLSIVSARSRMENMLKLTTKE